MSEKKQLFNNTIIIFISRIFTQFISFILLPFYTSFLSSGAYGLIDLINTYISLIIPIITIQLENAVFRFLVDNRENYDQSSKIINLSIKIIFKLVIIFTILAFILSLFIKINYLLLILINIIILIISRLLLQIARGLGNIKEYSMTSCIIGISTIILNIALILFTNMRVDAILLSTIIGNIIGIIYLSYKLNIKKYINFKLKDDALKNDLIKYSIPLIPNSISWWIFNVSDRTIISIFMGVTSNGIYAISNKFSNLIITVFGVFELAWVESTSKNINKENKDKYFSEVINTILKLTISLTIILLLVLPLVFNHFINVSYAESYIYIPILIISSIFSVLSSLYSSIYIALKKTKDIMYTSLVAAVINIILNIVFIRAFGLYAAALSTMISYITMFYLRYNDLKQYITIKYDLDILKYIALFMFTILLYYTKGFIFNILSLIIIGYILYKLQKNNIKTYKNNIINNLTRKIKKL